MNISILLITLGIIVATVIPIVAINNSTKNKRKRKLQQFMALGEKHQLNINEFDLSSYASLGMDDKSGKLLYVHGKHAPDGEMVIDLKNYRSCEAANISRSVGSQQNLTTIIDRVELVLKPKVVTDKEVKLEFFNSEHDSHITDENDLVVRWAGIINQRIKKN